jgi:hypothetical protein
MTELTWAHRLDHYGKTDSDYIHYWHILTSIFIVGLLGCYMMRSMDGIIAQDIFRLELFSDSLREYRTRRRQGAYE